MLTLMRYESYHFIATKFHGITGGDVGEIRWYRVGGSTCVVFGERPSQILSFPDSAYPENRANDTCPLVVFQISFNIINEMPNTVAGIQ